MGEESIIETEGKQVTITHADKVLIKDAGLTKLDFVDYYLQVSQPLLLYGVGRPLSEVRYPKGFPGVSFFQRNKPKTSPEWVESQALGVHQKADYILLNNIATVLWLVNLGSIELHAAQVAVPRLESPDVIVFDIDPPDGWGYKEVIDFAIAIKPIIESYGYTTYVKTSGKSGVHIYCPIQSTYSFDEVFAAAKDIGEDIAGRFSECTLSVSKKDRVNKVLLDIYRNHSYQSMSLPYGVRATSKASVSMPLSWRHLRKVDSPDQFNIKNVPEWITKHENPWRHMKDNTIPIHLKR